VTAAVLTQLPLRRRVGARLFAAVGVFGVAAVTFGFSQSYWLSACAVIVLGAADMVSVYVRGTLVPLATPDALRGRVVAVEAVFIGASNELGRFVAGSAAAVIGPVAAVVAGGGLTLAVTLLWSRLFPPLRRVDRFEDVLAA
jgi:MFS family permease